MKAQVGDRVFVRANTRDDYIGLLVAVEGPFTVSLDQCSWIGDSGRFGAFMREGTTPNQETEFMGDGYTINWSLIGVWHHELPTKDVG